MESKRNNIGWIYVQTWWESCIVGRVVTTSMKYRATEYLVELNYYFRGENKAKWKKKQKKKHNISDSFVKNYN